MNCLKIARKEERDRSKIIADVNRKTVEHLMAGVESVAGRLTIGSVYSMIETFDNMVRVFLVRNKCVFTGVFVKIMLEKNAFLLPA